MTEIACKNEQVAMFFSERKGVEVAIQKVLCKMEFCKDIIT